MNSFKELNDLIAKYKQNSINTVNYNNAYTLNEFLRLVVENMENVSFDLDKVITILESLENEGLTNCVNNKINSMEQNGQLEKIINIEKFNALKTEIENSIIELKEKFENGLTENVNNIVAINEEIEKINSSLNSFYNYININIKDLETAIQEGKEENQKSIEVVKKELTSLVNSKTEKVENMIFGNFEYGIDNGQTSSMYGFLNNATYKKLKKGQVYTLIVKGFVNSGNNTTGKKLQVCAFTDKWDSVGTVQIEETEPTIKTTLFTPTEDIIYSISAYSYPSNDVKINVTVNWYMIVEGDKQHLTEYVKPNYDIESGFNLFSNSNVNRTTSNNGDFWNKTDFELLPYKVYTLSVNASIQANNNNSLACAYIYSDDWEDCKIIQFNQNEGSSTKQLTFIPQFKGIYNFGFYSRDKQGVNHKDLATLNYYTLKQGVNPSLWTPSIKDLKSEIEENKPVLEFNNPTLPTINIIYYIKGKEGFAPRSYQDLAGVTTIGYGSTTGEIMNQSTVTESYATEFLTAKIKDGFTAPLVKLLQNNNINYNANMLDAMSSFAYNLGLGALQESTWWSILKSNKLEDKKQEFINSWLAHNHVGTSVVNGLTIRRNEEIKIFFNSGNVQGYNTPPVISIVNTNGNSTSEVVRDNGGRGAIPKI